MKNNDKEIKKWIFDIDIGKQKVIHTFEEIGHDEKDIEINAKDIFRVLREQERERILKIIRMEINDTTLKLFLTSLKFKKLNKEFEIHEAIKTILGEYREFFLKDLIKEIEK